MIFICLEDPFEMSCFIYLDLKTIKEGLTQNDAERLPISIAIPCLTNVINHDTNTEKVFIYQERHSIDKSLFSEESSSSFHRIPIDKCSIKANAFSDLTFEVKVKNF